TTVSPNSKTTTPRTTTAPTTSQLITVLYIRLHITNLAYSTTLNDPTSAYFQELQNKIKALYNETYGCSTCATRDTYLSVVILIFSPGSVIADTQVKFKGPETSSNVQTLLTNKLSESNNNYQELQISGVQASTIQFTLSSAEVPGWGIALLVLASVLVFLIIVFIIVMIVLLCRRKHRGHMDVFASRGSYHSMNDYTAYQTHGRYVAPNSYEVSQSTAGNGMKDKYSYTNQGLETNNL
ncbi:mucin-1, partial [Mantella aurantiaca]